MTRWARHGSTQQHKKPPEDPTPWSELALQTDDGQSSKQISKQFDKNKIDSHKLKRQLKAHKRLLKRENALSAGNSNIDEPLYVQSKCENANVMQKKRDRQLQSSSIDNGATIKFYQEVGGSQVEEIVHKNQNVNFIRKKMKKERQLQLSIADEHEIEDTVTSHYEAKKVSQPDEFNELFHNPSDDEAGSVVTKKKKSTSKKKQHLTTTDVEGMVSGLEGYAGAKIRDNSSSNSGETDLVRKSKRKKRRNKDKISEEQVKENRVKSEKLSIQGSEEEKDRQLSELPSNETANAEEEKINMKSGKKNKKYIDRIREGRQNKSILLLPKKAENKLYRLKKALRKKGVDVSEIKDIVRKARRKEELLFRKTFNVKACYNCRQIGHVLASCPNLATDVEQGTGICFKCGSTEHKSFRCHVQSPDFKFAKCFICHEQGHLSRNCPQNDHGAYPKGGKCNLCGEIDHLKKDCPKLKKKKKNAEEEITASTISDFATIDDIAESKPSGITVKKEHKIVKF